jgi:4-amino-4-deoxy-L-arabinose transferase-like glycosyltransferase
MNIHTNIFSQRTRLTVFTVMTTMVLLVSSMVLLLQKAETVFHGDESGWIASGYYYTHLLLDRDFGWRKWHNQDLGPWGYMNPHVGKWLIGLPLEWQIEENTFTHLYNFDKSLAENKNEGNVPSKEMLLHARAVSAIFGGLCCAVGFAVGYLCYGRWVGILSPALLLSNTLFCTYATRAMTDMPYNFFLLCATFCTILLFLKRSKRHTKLVSMLIGVSIGLCCSVKITGIVLGCLFMGVILPYRGLVERNKKEILASFTVFFVSAIAVIYSLNPLFWPDLSAIQVDTLGHELTSIPQELSKSISKGEVPRRAEFEMYISKYPQLSNLSRMLIFPYLFLKWNSLMDQQKSRWSDDWHGNRLKTFHKSLLMSHSTFFLESFFMLIGSIVCIKRIYTSLCEKKSTLGSIPFLYLLCNYLFILTFMKLNWERYYLPTVIASKIMVAVGIVGLITLMHHYYRHYQEAKMH